MGACRTFDDRGSAHVQRPRPPGVLLLDVRRSHPALVPRGDTAAVAPERLRRGHGRTARALDTTDPARAVRRGLTRSRISTVGAVVEDHDARPVQLPRAVS